VGEGRGEGKSTDITYRVVKERAFMEKGVEEGRLGERVKAPFLSPFVQKGRNRANLF
jgi:hypothetical protein